MHKMHYYKFIVIKNKAVIIITMLYYFAFDNYMYGFERLYEFLYETIDEWIIVFVV